MQTFLLPLETNGQHIGDLEVKYDEDIVSVTLIKKGKLRDSLDIDMLQSFLFRDVWQQIQDAGVAHITDSHSHLLIDPQ